MASQGCDGSHCSEISGYLCGFIECWAGKHDLFRSGHQFKLGLSISLAYEVLVDHYSPYLLHRIHLGWSTADEFNNDHNTMKHSCVDTDFFEADH